MEFVMGLFVGLVFWEVIAITLLFGVGVWFSTFDGTGEEALGFAFAFAAFLIVAEFFFDWSVFATITQYPVLVLGAAAIYFVGGGLWALAVSWPEWLESRSSSMKTDQLSYFKHNKDATLESFFDSYEYSKYTAANNKGRIMAMITLWFFDALWKATHRPIRWAARNIYELFATQFSKVGINTSRKILDDE